MKFVISGAFYKGRTFPGLNEYIAELGKNPKAGGRFKSTYMMIACNAIRRDLKRFQTDKPVILHYHFHEPQKGKKRDVMNIFSFADKVIEDALVKCEVISDDGPKHLINTTHDFYYSLHPRIEVEIEEVNVYDKRAENRDFYQKT